MPIFQNRVNDPHFSVQISERFFTNRLKKHPFPLQISEEIKIFSQKGCAFGLSQWELVEG
jgi:hypothetical protein